MIASTLLVIGLNCPLLLSCGGGIVMQMLDY